MSSAAEVTKIWVEEDAFPHSPMAVVDLNEDGAEEVLVTTTVGVSWVNGDGTSHAIWRGTEVLGVASADPDSLPSTSFFLLVSASDPETVDILHLECSGTTPPECDQTGKVTVDASVFGIAAADLNEDGVTDIVTVSTDNITYLLGESSDGGGTTWPGADILANGYFFHDIYLYQTVISILDFDQDGHQDVLTNAGFHTRVYFGDGTGRSTSTVDLDVPSHCLGDHARPLVGHEAPPAVVMDCGSRTLLFELEEVAPLQALELENGGEASEHLGGVFDENGGMVFSLAPLLEAAWLHRRDEQGNWTTRTITVPLKDVVESAAIAVDLDGDGIDEIAVVDMAPNAEVW